MVDGNFEDEHAWLLFSMNPFVATSGIKATASNTNGSLCLIESARSAYTRPCSD